MSTASKNCLFVQKFCLLKWILMRKLMLPRPTTHVVGIIDIWNQKWTKNLSPWISMSLSKSVNLKWLSSILVLIQKKTKNLEGFSRYSFTFPNEGETTGLRQIPRKRNLFQDSSYLCEISQWLFLVIKEKNYWSAKWWCTWNFLLHSNNLTTS